MSETRLTFAVDVGAKVNPDTSAPNHAASRGVNRGGGNA
jgi:hypothetical protein